MSIMIRKADINDAKLLARLNMAVQQPHIDAMPERFKPLTPDTPELIAFFETRLSEDRTHTFIAEDNAEPVGYVHCILEEIPDHVFVYGILDFHIDQIAVLDSHQGQGIGKLLMEHAMKLGKEVKADRISLGVVAFNEGAIRFYEQLGFSIASHRMSMSIRDE